MSVFAQPEALPAPPKNAADDKGAPIIHKADWGDAASTIVMLIATLPGTGVDAQPYALNGTDPYGSSPLLRAELDRMVDEEGLVIGPYVPEVEAKPTPEADSK